MKYNKYFPELLPLEARFFHGQHCSVYPLPTAKRPFASDFSFCFWNAQSLFTRNDPRRSKGIKAVVHLSSLYDTVCVQETRGTAADVSRLSALLGDQFSVYASHDFIGEESSRIGGGGLLYAVRNRV